MMKLFEQAVDNSGIPDVLQNYENLVLEAMQLAAVPESYHKKFSDPKAFGNVVV